MNCLSLVLFVFRHFYRVGSFLTLPQHSSERDLIMNLLESLNHIDWKNLDIRTGPELNVPSVALTDLDSLGGSEPPLKEVRKQSVKIKVRKVVLS